MNSESWIALASEAAVICGVAIGAYLKLIDRMNRNESNALERHNRQDARLIRIETFIELAGKNLAEFLHHPVTPEFDKLAEKYCRGEFLTVEEWKSLKNQCDTLQ